MLGNFKNTIYLLSMDDTIVANSLKEVQKYDGYKYLEKIVQVPLRLPLSKKEDIFNYLYKNLQEILKDFLKYLRWSVEVVSTDHFRFLIPLLRNKIFSCQLL